MYFAVPISKKETITDTPIDAKSIRSFFIVDRKGNFQMYNKNGFTSISIQIDGKDICNDLVIYPFVSQGTLSEQIYYAPVDSRRISIMCLKNVDLSEIKISANNVNLDFEVVFEYSDVRVETEMVNFIESKPIVFNLTNFTSIFGAKPALATMGQEVQLETKEEAKRIFVYGGSMLNGQIYNNSVPMYSKSYYYTYQNTNYMAHPKFVLNTQNEAMPKDFPVSMITPTPKTTWQEVQYTFDKKITKYPRFRFERNNTYGDLSSLFCIIYLSYDKKL